MSRVRVIIKLGGAAITDKDLFETAKQSVIEQLAQQIANMLTCQGGAAIIVHGAGRCCCKSGVSGLQLLDMQPSVTDTHASAVLGIIKPVDTAWLLAASIAPMSSMGLL